MHIPIAVFQKPIIIRFFWTTFPCPLVYIIQVTGYIAI